MLDWFKARLLPGSLIISGILALALAWSLHALSSAKEVIRDLSSWQDSVIGSIELATGSQDLDPQAAQIQLLALDQAHASLKQKTASQNAEITRLAEATETARKKQQEELAARAVAVAKAKDLETRLREQAKTTVPADEVEARIRKLQDELYEAGL